MQSFDIRADLFCFFIVLLLLFVKVWQISEDNSDINILYQNKDITFYLPVHLTVIFDAVLCHQRLRSYGDGTSTQSLV